MWLETWGIACILWIRKSNSASLVPLGAVGDSGENRRELMPIWTLGGNGLWRPVQSILIEVFAWVLPFESSEEGTEERQHTSR